MKFEDLLTPAAVDGKYTFRGRSFTQLFQRLPELAPTYTQAEADYSPQPLQDWMHSVPWLPVVACVVYMLFCYFGTKIMKNRKRFSLRYTLASWNFLLSVFSLIGAFRTVPHLMVNIHTQTFRDTVCIGPAVEWGAGATGFWVQMFILSKFPELIDTVFIVLRKSNLIFLHWYHHVTVLLFCWNSYVTESSSGLYFVAMNYTVHGIMYGYYCGMALKIPMWWFPSILLTGMQISQMVVGVFVVCMCWYYKLVDDEPCANDMTNLYAGALMYSSYLLLFVQFFFKRYIFPKPEEEAKKEAKKKQ